MSALSQLLVWYLIIIFPLRASAEEIAPTVEKSAFNNAANTLIDFRKSRTLGDSEMKWSRSLKTLAMSRSKEASISLAQLGLFSMDGAFSEEFSCAVAKQGKEFTVQLQHQLENFYSSNACFKIANKEGVAKEELCATKKEFMRLVKRYRRLPLEDNEGVCSY